MSLTHLCSLIYTEYRKSSREGCEMAEPTGSIFNKKATEKLRSPDDLDKYVRVTNASVWAIIAAFSLLIAGLLAWAVFGSISTNVTTKGTYLQDGDVVCFLPYDQAITVSVGNEANVGGEQMTVASLSGLPLSRDEAKDVLGSDFLTSSLVSDDWIYVVKFNGDGDYDFEVGYPIQVSITTETIAPISFVLGGKS